MILRCKERLSWTRICPFLSWATSVKKGEVYDWHPLNYGASNKH